MEQAIHAHTPAVPDSILQPPVVTPVAANQKTWVDYLIYFIGGLVAFGILLFIYAMWSRRGLQAPMQPLMQQPGLQQIQQPILQQQQQPVQQQLQQQLQQQQPGTLALPKFSLSRSPSGE